MSIKYIGITGKARAGKDTVCEMLCADLDCAVRYGLADPIKAAVFAMLGLDSLSERANLEATKDETIPWLGRSFRDLVRSFGTSGRGIDEDFWLCFLGKFSESLIEMEACFSDADQHKPLYVIVPDVRYNNEANWIKERQGIILKVDREVEPVSPHHSENGISVRYVDYVLDNSGNLEELKEKVQTIIKEENLNE